MRWIFVYVISPSLSLPLKFSDCANRLRRLRVDDPAPEDDWPPQFEDDATTNAKLRKLSGREWTENTVILSVYTANINLADIKLQQTLSLEKYQLDNLKKYNPISNAEKNSQITTRC